MTERSIRWVALVAVCGLLIAILVLLAGITRHGIRIEYAGDVRIVGMPSEIALRMEEPVRLTMPNGTQLTASLSDGASIPVAVTLLTCPECGGTLLPTRWNVFTGEIDWTCPTCGEDAATR